MKLRTRLLVFSSVFLVMLPWLAYHFIEKIEYSLLQGQEEAQSMTASAIATVLSGYSELFDIEEHALYVYPVTHSINVDGYDEDWGILTQRYTPFSDGAFSLLLANNLTAKDTTGKGGLSKSESASDGQYLYAYLKVNDDDIVYRNPRYNSLDSSDHIRLDYIDTNDKHRRLVLVAEGQGNISVYEVAKDWTTRLDANQVGTLLGAIFGVWRETRTGYALELRLPITWLEPKRRLSLSIVDVYSDNERYPDKIVSTYEKAVSITGNNNYDSGALNPLLFQSRIVSSVLKNLSASDSRICVVDRYRRVLAVTGGDKLHASFCQATDKVSANLVDKVLRAKNDKLQSRESKIYGSQNYESAQVEHISEDGEILIVAAIPVFDGEKIIGAVLVSKDSQQILSRQRDTLNDVVVATLGIFFLVFFSLLIFSSWLAFRINRLKKQVSVVIDDSGRFIAEAYLSDSNYDDEIGELSRSFSSLLIKLNSYTNFLETVPRMLRHEILNPVNTISMSLQNLAQGDTDACSATNPAADIAATGIKAANITATNITAANKAIKQLQLIVSSLTEAASIDEALSHDETEKLDIAALLDEYVHNVQGKHKDALLRYQGVTKSIFVTGNDIRLVQLFDKIKDNALDFAYPDTEILFQLEIDDKGNAVISIKNEGEMIPQQQLAVLFQGMVSQRAAERSIDVGATDNTSPHLGIGLYVSHKIARFHNGQLRIANRGDKQGVEVLLVLPVIQQ